MSEIKPATFRLDTTTTEKFKELASDFGVTQDKMLQELMGTFELENAKVNLADRGKEIDEFQTIAQRMIRIYLNSLELNQNSEERIKDQFQEQLVKKQELIFNLQEQNKLCREDLKNKDALLKDTLNLNAKSKEEVIQIKNTLDTKETLIVEYNNKINMLTTLVTEYTQYKDDINIIKEDLEKSNKAKETLTYAAKDINLENGNLNKQIKLLENSIKDNKESILQIKAENKENIKQLKDEHNVALEYKNKELEKATKELKDKVNELILNNKEELAGELEAYKGNANKMKEQFEKEINVIENRSSEKLEMEIEKITLKYDRLIFDKDKEIEALKNKKNIK